MSPSALLDLGATSREISDLEPQAARSVMNFLLRWEDFNGAIKVLDDWKRDEMLTAQDLRIRALLGMERGDVAVRLIGKRIDQKDSVYSQILKGRALLAIGNVRGALVHAEGLVQSNPKYGPNYGLLGDAAIASGDFDGAQKAFLQYQRISPSARPPQIGMAEIALAQGDSVTAAAFATSAIEEGGIDGGPASEILRKAIQILHAAANTVQAENAEERLKALYASELKEMRSLIAGEFVAESPRTQSRERQRDRQTTREDRTAEPSSTPTPSLPPPTPAASAADIPVSDAERARMNHALKQLFGFDSLLPWQPQIVAATLRGEDVLAILPTGGGKSLTYQLPTFMHLAEEGANGNQGGNQGGNQNGNQNGKTLYPLTFVISPLIALMKDQVDNLPPALRARTVALTSSMSAAELNGAMDGIVRGDYELVYAAPERLRNPEFVATLAARGVGRLVIDEAHCVSSWGHNFRPDYLHIATAHRDLGAPPILALTATAPVAVRQDIERHLFHKSQHAANGSGTRDAGAPPTRALRAIVADSYRANLMLGAVECADEAEKRANLVSLCKSLNGCGLVYARSRALCEDLAQMLRDQGENADFYHAGMPPQLRTESQNRFMAGTTRILVATVAFGMGIDKSDIRFIVHFGLPSSLEAYYQEAGRAGRDHAISHCVLLYATRDRTSLASLASRDRVNIEFLRSTYAAARALMNGSNPGIVSTSALLARLALDNMQDTKVRVALSMLEEAGMLDRAYDAPRTVQIGLTRAPSDAAVRDFCERIGLAPGQMQEWGYLELCTRGGFDATQADLLFNRWAAEGKLGYRGQGREMLIRLSTQKAATTQVEAVLSRFAAVQKQQVADIFAYARAKRCRHGYLSAYLGGHQRPRCESCDACKSSTMPRMQTGLPDAYKQRMVVLHSLRGYGRGVVTLSKILQGDTTLDGRQQAAEGFGKLSYLGRGGIEKLIRAMLRDDLLQTRDLDNGGTIVELSDTGRAALSKQKSHQ